MIFGFISRARQRENTDAAVSHFPTDNKFLVHFRASLSTDTSNFLLPDHRPRLSQLTWCYDRFSIKHSACHFERNTSGIV
jgi:hypothetical protein